ncbi:hypothetical protein JXM83_00415 [Candidatus Woesearchaeota archaeon]|nr:hypothetical protein [Candidatus Woesearchaeota archaeon]
MSGLESIVLDGRFSSDAKKEIISAQEISKEISLPVDVLSYLNLENLFSDFVKGAKKKYLAFAGSSLAYLLLKSQRNFNHTLSNFSQDRRVDISKYIVFSVDDLKKYSSESLFDEEKYTSPSFIFDREKLNVGNYLFQLIESDLSSIPRIDFKDSTLEFNDYAIRKIRSISHYSEFFNKYSVFLESQNDFILASQLDLIPKLFLDYEKVFSEFKKNESIKYMDSVLRAHAVYNGLVPSKFSSVYPFLERTGQEMQFVIDLATQAKIASDVLLSYDLSEGKKPFIYVTSDGQFKSFTSDSSLAGQTGEKKLDTISTLVGAWCDSLTRVFTHKNVYSPFNRLDEMLRYFGISDELSTKLSEKFSLEIMNRQLTGTGTVDVPNSFVDATGVVFDNMNLLTVDEYRGSKFAESLKYLMENFLGKTLNDCSYRLFSSNTSHLADNIRKQINVFDTEKNEDIVSFKRIGNNVESMLSSVSRLFPGEKYEIFQGGNSGVCTVFSIGNLFQIYVPYQSKIEVLDSFESVREIDPFSSTVVLSQIYAHETVHLAQINTPLMWKNILNSILGFVATNAKKDIEENKLDVVSSFSRESSMFHKYDETQRTRVNFYETLIDEYSALCIGKGDLADNLRKIGLYNAFTEVNVQYGCVVRNKSGQKIVSFVQPGIMLKRRDYENIIAEEHLVDWQKKTQEWSEQGYDLEEKIQEYISSQTSVADDSFSKLRSELQQAKASNDVEAIEKIRQKIAIHKKQRNELYRQSWIETVEKSQYAKSLKELQDAVDSLNSSRIDSAIRNIEDLGLIVDRGTSFFERDGSFRTEHYTSIKLDDTPNTRIARANIKSLKTALHRHDVVTLDRLVKYFKNRQDEFGAMIETQAESFSLYLVKKMIDEYSPDTEFTDESREFYKSEIEKSMLSAGKRALLYQELISDSKLDFAQISSRLSMKGLIYSRVLNSENTRKSTENLFKLGYSPINPTEAYDSISGLLERIKNYNLENPNSKILFKDCLRPMNQARMQIDLKYRAHIPLFTELLDKFGPEDAFSMIVNSETMDDIRRYLK